MVLEEQHGDGTISRRNGLAHVTSSYTSPTWHPPLALTSHTGSIPYPMLHVIRAKPAPPTLQTLAAEIESTHEEEKHTRFPTWALQDALIASTNAQVLVGVPSLAASPNIAEVWGPVAPSKWTAHQQEVVSSATRGILFLHGSREDQLEALNRIHALTLQGAEWLIAHESGMPGSAYQRLMNTHLSNWTALSGHLPGKLNLWQQTGKWACCTPPQPPRTRA